MHLKGPSRLLGAANELAGLLVRRRLSAAKASASRRTRPRRSAAGTRRWQASTSALSEARPQYVRVNDVDGRGARVLHAFAEERRRNVEDVRGFGSGHVENLADDVRESVRAVQTLQHAERASHLHFLRQHRSLSVCGTVR